MTGDAFVSICIEMQVVFLADLQQEPRPCLELAGEEGSVLCSLEREISPDLGEELIILYAGLLPSDRSI